MYTALRSTSITIRERLEQSLQSDPYLGDSFTPAAGGQMVTTLNTPEEMISQTQEGVSVWLYRIERDDQRLNAPPRRSSSTEQPHVALPLRLHYLVTPVVTPPDAELGIAPEFEQTILGRVLQCFHDTPTLSGSLLADDFTGTDLALRVRLETQGLEEITRVWDALQRSYQLCVSYEVSVVYVESGLQPNQETPVSTFEPEFGIATPAVAEI